MRRIVAGFFIISVLAAPLSAAETAAPALSPAAPSAPAPAAEKDTAADPAAAKRFRVGYADIMKIAEKSDAGKAAKARFEEKADRLKTQIDAKQKLLEKQKAALEAKLPTYTPEQRAAKIKAYEKKVDELRKLLQQADKEMKPMQEELTLEIFGKIEKTAGAYGAAHGFDIILAKRELLYLGSNADAEDVTDNLIKELNR
jgi:outer membrane protein